MLPRWLSDKEFACQCRKCKRCGFGPWFGEIPWRRTWQPTPVFLPEKSHGWRILACPCGYKELDMTEWAWSGLWRMGAKKYSLTWLSHAKQRVETRYLFSLQSRYCISKFFKKPSYSLSVQKEMFILKDYFLGVHSTKVQQTAKHLSLH